MHKGRPGPLYPYAAAADVPQYRFVSHGATDDEVLAAGAGDKLFGVSARPARRSGSVDVALYGAHPVEYGAAVERGDALTSDAEGRAVPATAGRSGGVALMSGEAGDIGAIAVAQAAAPAAGGGAPRILVARTDNPMVGSGAELRLPAAGAGLAWGHLDVKGRHWYGADADAVEDADSSENKGWFEGTYHRDEDDRVSWVQSENNRNVWHAFANHNTGTTYAVGILSGDFSPFRAGLYSIEYSPDDDTLAIVEAAAPTGAPRLVPFVASLLVTGYAMASA